MTNPQNRSSGNKTARGLRQRPSGWPVGSFDSYTDAQAAVDKLSDMEFPVSQLTIVGVDLMEVERVTGRLTWGRVIGGGALSGAWLGVFFGLLLSILGLGFWTPMLLGDENMPASTFGDPALYVALLMALFAGLFGTRQVDATEHRPGMMLAIALESLVKLVALVTVGVFAVFWFNGRELALTDAARELMVNTPSVGFAGQMLLAFTAIICLPRQFHVAVVECVDVRDIRRARWLFGGYLVLISLMVLPIAAAGAALFAGDGSVLADTYVLALPLAEHRDALALFAYVGGFSAATGMVIVASVALAIMVSNDLVMPLLLRRGWAQRHGGDVASTVLWVRRIAILCFALLAYGYYRASGSDTSLAAFGLMAFAAVAQFAPALIGGLYWRGASRQGVEAGLLIGFGVWIYTLLLPTLTDAGWLAQGWMQRGPFGIGWLRPRQLFGIEGWDPLTHGTFWSLLLNIGALLLVSARWRPGLEERLRAAPFLDPYAQRRALGASDWRGVPIADLQALARRVVGGSAARRAFADFDPARVARFNRRSIERLLADPGIIRNRLKVESAVGNAKCFLAVQEEFGSFCDYIWRFVDGRPKQNRLKKQSEVAATSPESDAMSKDMRQRGFRFVGPTTTYSFMQAAGLVNDHLLSCFCRNVS